MVQTDTAQDDLDHRLAQRFSFGVSGGGRGKEPVL